MDTQNKNQEDNRPKIENHMENCNVFMGDSYGGIFPLPGAQVTIHQHLDPKKMKKGEGQQTYGNVGSKEERDQRKVEVMKAITDKFEFEESMLCYDSQRKKITNERLASLFRKCFGIGYIPPTLERRNVQEQLWVLLMDERNQCSKVNGEGFFRQTVLNIVGYFMTKDLLNGMPLKVAQCLFPDIDNNKVKNLTRAIPDNFPAGTKEMIDHYIDKLQNGEF